MKEEWEYYMKNGINVRVIDMPTLNIDYKNADEKLEPMIELIKSVVFDILSWEAEAQRQDILETQRQGIESAKREGRHLGRPKRLINYKLFKKEYEMWKNGEQTASLTMKKLGWSKSFFYNVVKKYEGEILVNKE